MSAVPKPFAPTRAHSSSVSTRASGSRKKLLSLRVIIYTSKLHQTGIACRNGQHEILDDPSPLRDMDYRSWSQPHCIHLDNSLASNVSLSLVGAQ
jgi:hypothetical protein